jgi:large subunit ribosomal protein L21e
MVKHSKGYLATRTKKLKGKGRLRVSDFVKTFEIGEKVTIDPKCYNHGLPHLRYINRSGQIVEKRGNAYVVEIYDGDKKKYIIAHPVHLNKVG